MPEKFKTIKLAEKPEWWIWEGTKVVKFACYPDVVDTFIQSYIDMYDEQGYELLDSIVEKGSMFSRVKLLIRPKREEEKSRMELISKAEAQDVKYFMLETLPENIQFFDGQLEGGEQFLSLALFNVGLKRFTEMLPQEARETLRKLLMRVDDLNG